MAWEPLHDVPVPAGCVPCRLCGKRCMVAEMIEHDWEGRGRVIRIWSNCDESDDFEKDDIRTEFEPEAEAVAEWNEMQQVETR